MLRSLNILILALGAMIAIIVGIAWVQSTSAASPHPADMVTRCGTCHQMGTEITSWQQGSHRDVACTACHADKGVWGWLHMQAAQERMEVVARWGEVNPGTIDTDVPNRRCIACHARQMPFVMQDLKPPLPAPVTLAAAYAPPDPATRAQLDFMPASAGHDLHLSGQPGLRCTDCHSGTSHGPMPSIKEGRDDFHNLCQDCHDQQNVTVPVRSSVGCVACHQDVGRILPADHNSDWRSQHGQATRTQNCGECHLADSAGPHGKLSRPAAFPVAETGAVLRVSTTTRPESATADACMACHRTPMPHPQGWMSQHPVQFRQQPAVCADCHGTRGQPLAARYVGNPADLPNTPACTNCHQAPVPHPAGYLRLHGRDAVGKGAESCRQCHSPTNPVNSRAPHAAANFCANCHAGASMPHPAGFLSSHGQAALASGEQTCARCHSPLSPVRPLPDHAAASFCTSCHAQPMPHSTGYLASHGQEAARAPATCRICHSPANPVQPAAPHAAADYCTRCHSQPMPHAAGYLNVHGSAAQNAPSTCQTCHSPANTVRPAAAHAAAIFCAACHDAYRHPARWLTAHGQQVDSSCATCHTEQKNACSTCHQSPATYKGQGWHPDAYWWVTHGKAALAQGEATCSTCHAEVKPSCTQCHRNR